MVAGPVAVPDDLGTVRRPGRSLVLSRIVGHVDLVRAVGVHRVDLEVPVAFARECDPLSEGRPRCKSVPARSSELRQATPIGVHLVDLEGPTARAAAGEGYLGPIR